MNKRDYYEVLGVSKNATEQEIKSAFRKLSLKYHPDRQTGKSESEKKDAENHFKECAEAYEVLSDKQKRSNYDQFGFDGPQMSGGFGGFDIGDFMRNHASMFSDFFGGGSPFGHFGMHFGFGDDEQAVNAPPNPDHPENGRNVQVGMKISFKEAVNGCTKEFDINLSNPCPECHGKGIKNGSSYQKCTNCNGQGMITKRMQQGFMTQIISSPCPHCHGTGYSYEECPHCHGQKRIAAKKHIKVKIPSGVEDNQRLRLKEMGECGINGGQNGNLYVNVSIEQSDLFERHGINVKVVMPISPITATLGGKIDVPSPYGYVKVDVPKNCCSGKQTVVYGKGMKTQAGTGNLVVEFVVESISNLTAVQKNLLEQLSKTLQDSNLQKTQELKSKAQAFYN